MDDAAPTANTTPQQVAVAASHAECSVLHPSTKGNFVDQANCLTDDENNMTTVSDPNADLVKKLQTGRLSLAKQADAGTITPDQYATKLHKLETKINAQKAARANKAKAKAAAATAPATTTAN